MRGWLKPRGAGTDRGLTLLELAVAVLVLAIGTLAALAAADQSRLAIGQAKPRLLARIAAENRAAELRLPGIALPGTVEIGGMPVTLLAQYATTAAGLSEVTITARTAAGPGAVLVTWLPGVAP
ncbi:type IV pilus modification PilV family protein [Shimia biformata]|uniref:type IV pilus modification PilV family protein n=1 Tax=Shimia biformata TaxID=1294299 RepID=UPI001950CBC5|nr:prepilin-type N-terminal cleavage/methylation domain-containing protein [Shimia biformata]